MQNDRLKNFISQMKFMVRQKLVYDKLVKNTTKAFFHNIFFNTYVKTNFIVVILIKFEFISTNF